MNTLTLLFLIACGSQKDAGDTAPIGFTVDCDSLGVDVPTARGEAAGTWDAQRRRLVFFGGDHGVPIECRSQTDFVGETWSFYPDCGKFDEVGGDGPSKRGRHVAVGDDQRMIIHGGRSRNGTEGDYILKDDVWVFDYATDTWERASGGGGPAARSNHAGVLADGTLYIHGGSTSTDGGFYIPQSDVWAFDLASESWEELSTSGTGPDARLFHAAATDGDFMYLYGGGDEGAFLGPFFGDLWALDLESLEWTELHGGDGGKMPDRRIWSTLTYDADGERLVLWAGHDDQQLGNRNDLWAFDLGTGKWDRLRNGDRPDQPANGFCDFPADFTIVDDESPERREAHVSAFTDDGTVITFGGKTDCGLINDAWSYEPASDTWTQHVRATAGESCVRASRACETLCY